MERQGRAGKGPERLGAVLEALFEQQGIEEPIRIHRTVVDWESVVGESVARHARAAHVEHGTMIVEVDSPAWMHRLQLEESALRTRINQHFGEEIIRHIRFRLGSPE